MRASAPVLVALFAATGLVRAEPVAPRLADLALGEHWFGREITLAELEGKVVLLVLWGS